MRTTVLMLSLVMTLFAASNSWSSQQEQPAKEAAQAPATHQTAKGELSRVDAASKSFWIKAADGSEMEFKYDDKTEVTGAAKNAEGLAGTSGSKVAVEFEKAEGANKALKIEVMSRS
jgi:hypothetical protein